MRRIVQVLEQQFPDVPRQNPDELARHCTEADLWDPAIEYWQQAARIALVDALRVEAEAQVETAIALLTNVSDVAATLADRSQSAGPAWRLLCP